MRAMADGRWHGSIGNGLTTEDEEHSSETTEKARRGARGIRAPWGSRSSPPARPRHLQAPARGEDAPAQDEATAARVRRGAGARAHDATSAHSVCEDA